VERDHRAQLEALKGHDAPDGTHAKGQIELAQDRAQENARKVRELESRLARLQGQYERQDTAKRFQKADLDSKRSFHDLKIDREQYAEATSYRHTTIDPSERKLEELTREFEATVRAINEAKLEQSLYRSLVVEVDDALPGSPALAAGFKKGDQIPSEEF